MNKLFLSTLLALAAVQAVFTIDTVPGTCVDDSDCSLLGDCIDGRCVCDVGFTGSNCHKFDLIPARDPNIEGHDNPNYPTWGGKSIWSDGKWHFIGSYIKNKCDIWDYGTNSAWMRASGPTPLGPFTYEEDVLSQFRHGAQLTRAPDGGYMVWGDGRDTPDSTLKKCGGLPGRGLEETFKTDSEEPGVQDNQEEETRLRSLQKRKGKGNGGQSAIYPYGDSPNDVHLVAYSKTIYGPWEQIPLPDLKTELPEKRWNCNKTNLAPVILNNGTVVVAYRTKTCETTREAKCGLKCQQIAIAVSHNGPRGKFVLRDKPIEELDGNEDPFMWNNKRGWFLVMHGKWHCGNSQSDINTCGTFAFSRDTYEWHLSPYPIYDGEVQFDPSLNMAPQTLEMRHRPKITFNNEGVPLVLYNAGKKFGKFYVRSFAFAFNVPDMLNYRDPPPCPPKHFENKCTEFTRNGYTYTRTRNGCTLMGAQNCIYCESKGKCMPGSDDRICEASSIKTFYAHC